VVANRSYKIDNLLVKGLRHPIVLEIDEADVNNAMNMVRGREFLLRIAAGLGPR